MAMQNLAITLRIQSTRTAGAPGVRLLDEAVDAFRAALRVFTKADNPMQWGLGVADLFSVTSLASARVIAKIPARAENGCFTICASDNGLAPEVISRG